MLRLNCWHLKQVYARLKYPVVIWFGFDLNDDLRIPELRESKDLIFERFEPLNLMPFQADYPLGICSSLILKFNSCPKFVLEYWIVLKFWTVSWNVLKFSYSALPLLLTVTELTDVELNYSLVCSHMLKTRSLWSQR